MNSFSPFQTAPQISRLFGQRFDNAHFGVFRYITSSGSQFPLLDLPSSIPTSDWSLFAHDGKAKIEMPEASKLLTQCYKECQLIHFNLNFLQFIVAEPSFHTSLNSRIDLDLLVNLYLTLSSGAVISSGGDVISFGKETIRKTLAYYLGEEYFLQSLFWIKIGMLRDARKTVEAEFVQKLTALPPFRHNKTEFKVSREQAERDIKIVTQEMEAQIDNFFAAKVNAHIFSMTYRSTGVVVAESEAEKLVDDPKVRAMLDVIVYAEGTGDDYGKIANGIVKKSPYYPELIGQKNVKITNFSRHPEISVDYGPKWTTAAGRYQFLYKTWKDVGGDNYDFSPRSQDIIAVKLMKRRKMIEPILKGNITEAINRGAPEWASFPMENGKSYHNQPVKKIEELLKIYNESIKKH